MAFVPLCATRGIAIILLTAVIAVGKDLASRAVFLVVLPVPAVDVSVHVRIHTLHRGKGTIGLQDSGINPVLISGLSLSIPTLGADIYRILPPGRSFTTEIRIRPCLLLYLAIHQAFSPFSNIGVPVGEYLLAAARRFSCFPFPGVSVAVHVAAGTCADATHRTRQLNMKGQPAQVKNMKQQTAQKHNSSTFTPQLDLYGVGQITALPLASGA